MQESVREKAWQQDTPGGQFAEGAGRSTAEPQIGKQYSRIGYQKLDHNEATRKSVASHLLFHALLFGDNTHTRVSHFL